MFETYKGYKEPVVKKLNAHVTIGISYPKHKGLDAVIDIYSSKKKSTITLFSKTLLDISNSYILDVLSRTDTFFFNKEKERKLNKRKKKKI